MKIINSTILLFFSLSLSTTILSQNTRIDSLKIDLENHKQNDTIRANLLIGIAESYFTTNIDSTQTYLTRAKIISTNLNYIKGKGDIFRLLARLEYMKSNYLKSIDFLKQSLTNYNLINSKEGAARVYIGLGINYSDLSKYEEAIIAYQKAEKIYQLLKNKIGIATCQMNMAIVYSELGKYDKSISIYKQVIALSNDIQDEIGVAYANTNLGEIYQEQGNYPLALKHFYKALSLRKKAADYVELTYTLHGLGEVYFAMQKYDKALAFFEKSLKHALQTDDKNNIVANNSCIGDIYLAKNDYENALRYYKYSLNISLEINNLKRIANSHNRIGNINLLLGKPALALKSFTQAIQISKKTNNQKIIADSYIGIAEAYLSRKEYQKAISYVKQGNHIANDLELLTVQKKAAYILNTIYKAIKNYKKALQNHERYKQLSDSILNKENIEKIAQLEYEHKYKQALDSASIRELKLTKTVLATSQDLEKSQRNYLWAIIGVLLISIILGTVIFYQKLKNAKSKTQNAIIEQKLLRSQMTPHFIFNSLSVLQGMILNKEDKSAILYLTKFSKLLRTILENSRHKTVALSQELSAINDYMALQNLDVKPPYNYTLLVASNINKKAVKIPPMLIQPFIENATEHAFPNNKENKEISVALKFEDETLVCTIIDNGIGIKIENQNTYRNKTSLATTITSERLKMLSQDFETPASLSIENRSIFGELGTLVTLVIPYKIELTS